MGHPPWLQNWLVRHQTPLCFWLHVIGIPLTIAALGLAIAQFLDGRWDLWWRPVALLFAGYFLQWVGHVYEGNELGEVILVKRMLGLPYRARSSWYTPPEPQTRGVLRAKDDRKEPALSGEPSKM